MTQVSFTLPEGVKSFNVSGPRHDGSCHAWVELEPVTDAHGGKVYGVSAGIYNLDGELQSAVDQAYAKASALMASELDRRANSPAPKSPRGLSSEKKETADLLKLLEL